LSILPGTYAEQSSTEKSDSKPIGALAASTAEELFTSFGPAEDSAEHRALEKEASFGYRQVLGDYRKPRILVTASRNSSKAYKIDLLRTSSMAQGRTLTYHQG
jgi:hypothetical protein